MQALQTPTRTHRAGRRFGFWGGIFRFMSTAPTEAQQRAWMAQWHAAAAALARVRLAEVEQADLARVALDLEDACMVSAHAARRSVSSGVLEQQRAFHRMPAP